MTHALIAITVLLLAGLCGCMSRAAVVERATPSKDFDGNGRIVGGQQTTIEKYPYQVSIRLDTYTLLHICGGSIYAPRVILTAAHCIKGRFASTILVVAGSSNIADESAEAVQASKLIYHNGYNKKTHQNDVGLIILARDLVYSSAIQPIALALDFPKVGASAVITGWGKSYEEAETLTNNLQEVEVHIMDRADCNRKYTPSEYEITEQMICAGVEEGGKDTCQGDSGGPLAVDGVLLGVVSWGIGCARPEYPGVYAAMPYHLQWIEDTAAPYIS